MKKHNRKPPRLDLGSHQTNYCGLGRGADRIGGISDHDRGNLSWFAEFNSSSYEK